MKEVDTIFGKLPVVFSYSREEAVQDGVLVSVGKIGIIDGDENTDVVFTANLFKNYKDNAELYSIVKKGIELLNKPDPEDDGRKLRVIEEGKIWVIYDGDGITFLKPEDY